jgi:chromosome segregation ATPase
MNRPAGTIVLALLCFGLIVALIWSQKRAAGQKRADSDSIGSYSNKWVETSTSLEQQRQVNTSLEGDLKKERDSVVELTNAFLQVSSNLDKSDAALKATQDEVARRGARIADLESQNLALDQGALDLNSAITNLSSQIDDTRRKLASSEGDKAFLEKELQRLLSERADLERQFNDISVLRAQVRKLKEEMNVSRRLEWMRKGLFARADQKGAEDLMLKSAAGTNRASREPSYDLNVEVSADGSVKVIPPLSDNAGTDSNAAPAQ